jgi:hypothetical protein
MLLCHTNSGVFRNDLDKAAHILLHNLSDFKVVAKKTYEELSQLLAADFK